jgi:hypothetical protein
MTVANLTTTVEEITDREIGLWKMRTVPLPKIDDALYEVKRCGEKQFKKICSLMRI